MFEKIKKIKENKFLQIIGKILYILLFVFVIFMLIIVILQRVSDNTIGLGDYKMFTVATGSMVPEYNVGDILISKTTTIHGQDTTDRILELRRDSEAPFVLRDQEGLP